MEDDVVACKGLWRTAAEENSFIEGTKCGANSSTREAIRVRDNFCEYFNNVGAVPWQWDQ